MRRIIWSLIVLLVVIILWIFNFHSSWIVGGMDIHNDISFQSTDTPHTPTGCPYGDSIPIDSPKCVAPPTEALVGPKFQGK